ncbi:hypothetical protein Aperf_G00000002676 [Anoplocephala perfoliata]
MNDREKLRNYLKKTPKLLDQDSIGQSTATANEVDNKEKAAREQLKEVESDSSCESPEEVFSTTDGNEADEDSFPSEIPSSEMMYKVDKGNDADFIECVKKLELLERSLQSFKKSFRSLVVNRIGIYRRPINSESEEQVEPKEESHVPLSVKKGEAGRRQALKALSSTSLNPDNTEDRMIPISEDPVSELFANEQKDLPLGPNIVEDSSVQPSSESLEPVNRSYPERTEGESSIAVEKSEESEAIRNTPARRTTQVDNSQIDSYRKAFLGITAISPSCGCEDEVWEDFSREEEMNRLMGEDQSVRQCREEFAKAKARAERYRRRLTNSDNTEEEIPKHLCVEEPQYWNFSEDDWKKRIAFEKKMLKAQHKL